MAANFYEVARVFRAYAVAPLYTGHVLIAQVRDGLRVLNPNGVLSDPVAVPVNLYYPFDIIAAPDFVFSHRIYITYAEQGPDRPDGGRDDGLGNGANLAILTGIIAVDANGQATLGDPRVIWRQSPRLTTPGEFGGRMRFSPDGRYLFVTVGDRNTFLPPQDKANTIGKIIRLNPDGSIPADNPFAGVAGVAPEIWTLGHRNPYGLDFDIQGRLWSHENGPEGGDEFNLIEEGANYGWPLVSYGNHYDGGLIPKPAAGDGYHQSALYWTPAIAPAGMTIYKSTRFPGLQNVAIIGALKGQALVFVSIAADGTAKEIDRLPTGFRVRDVRQAPDGSIYVVEDAKNSRIFRLLPQ